MREVMELCVCVVRGRVGGFVFQTYHRGRLNLKPFEYSGEGIRCDVGGPLDPHGLRNTKTR